MQRDKRECWDGVRNYQARNFMRDEMKIGDLVIFYHSNAKPPGAAGIVRVCSESYPDYSAWEEGSPYFDPKSTEDKPRWMMVDVEFIQKFTYFIPLALIKEQDELEGMLLLKKGMRLSVQPVEKKHFEKIKHMGSDASHALQK
jgi:predicted RNA-binding protein with PUA-like domain